MARPAFEGVVVTRTPLRVSFAGGGTDLAEYYERDYGAVLSTTIQQYVYVTVKRHSYLFGEPIRLNYSETEQVANLDQIRNDIARECFRFLSIEPPIYVSTVADVPASSGLGSSSAFAVGLLNALHCWRGEHVSAGQLAQEAAHIEIDVLKRPIGKQDHYAAAFGGFSFLRFLPGGGVSVEPQRFAPYSMRDLFDHLVLFWTGISRSAQDVLTEQRERTSANVPELTRLREHAHRLQALLRDDFDPVAFGRCIDEGWQIKRRLASGISDDRIDQWCARAMSAGATGGKILGAGGGGFLLFVVPPDRQLAVREALAALSEVPMRYEPQGSSILIPHGD